LNEKKGRRKKSQSEIVKRTWDTKRKRTPIGSKRLSSHGYVLIKVSHGSFTWEYEHKLKMEKKLGRKLKKGEVIHHIDKDRTHNWLYNLLLCEDNLEHIKIESTFTPLVKHLMKAGVVKFNRKKKEYYLNEKMIVGA
jgi:hypothetical protein